MSKKSRKHHKMATKPVAKAAIENRRARFDYEIGREIVVGLVLTGAETKAARMGRVSLRGSYVVARESSRKYSGGGKDISQKGVMKNQKIDSSAHARNDKSNFNSAKNKVKSVAKNGSRNEENRAELWLINASFSLPNFAMRTNGGAKNTVDTRSRKILAKRREIDELANAREKGMTIVPTKILTRGRFVKLTIALARGKKRFDKRESIKRKDLEREERGNWKKSRR